MSSSEAGTAKGVTEIDEPTRAQQQLARRVAESRATVPDLTLAAEADIEGSDAAPRDLAIFALARALREHPRVNGAYRDARFERYSRVNVGFAVDSGGAVVVPTIVDADVKSLAEIAAETAELEARVAELTAPALAGGTATVVALDARRVVPPLQLPQAVTLGVGSAAPRALVIEGAVAVRRAVDVTLVCDHRIVHGALAATFLGRVVELLQRPA